MSEAETLVSLFRSTVQRRGAATALRSKRDGVWRDTSWFDWEQRALVVAAYLVEVGVERGDRVAIFGTTRIEWVIVDLAVLMVGAITVPIYPSLIGEQAGYILRDSGAKVLFAEDASYIQRLAAFDPALLEELGGKRTVSFDALPVVGAPRRSSVAQEVDARIAAGRADDAATIVYTSGTTGPPKGVVLTHANLVFDTCALDSAIRLEPDDEQLLFLPLAHIFGKMLVMMQYRKGYTTSFAESVLKALDNAAEVNPTFMGSVPRLFEKVFAGANERAAAAGGLKRRLFRWATSAASAKRRGWQRYIADRMVLSKIRGRFGSRLRFAISGGAPLAKELAEWFDSAGVPVLEAYGLTETTGGTTINTARDCRFGTVGKPLTGVEVSLADDGEILVRGPSVMRGYWNNEDDTRSVIDERGWFHTGDIGVFDADGFLRITDRKKDIIITAGGKNVAPQNIENLLKQSSWISQAVIHGDNEPYLVAILTPNVETLTRFARASKLDGGTRDLISHPAVVAEVQRAVDAVNARLSSFETIKKFILVERDFSVEGGELTPTFKVKRKVVGDRYREAIANLYDG